MKSTAWNHSNENQNRSNTNSVPPLSYLPYSIIQTGLVIRRFLVKKKTNAAGTINALTHNVAIKRTRSFLTVSPFARMPGMSWRRENPFILSIFISNRTCQLCGVAQKPRALSIYLPGLKVPFLFLFQSCLSPWPLHWCRSRSGWW